MADIKYDILEELGVLSESAKGWKKELNLISRGLGNSIADKQERRGLRNERDTGWTIVGSAWFGKDNE